MNMEEKMPPNGAKDEGGEAEVEKAEVEIADVVESLAQLLRGLHKTNSAGETVAITEDEDKNAKIREITGMFAKLGASEEEVKKLADSLSDLAYSPDEDQETAKDEEPDGETEVVDDSDDSEDEFDDVTRDALKACGYDAESPEFQRAFAEDVKYGEKKEKEEPKKLDREHEREGEERYLRGAQDAALMRRVAVLEKESKIRTALDECSKVLGKVRVTAFDSAEDVYIEALKQKGVSVRGVSKKNARALYLGVLRGEASAAKSREIIAKDSALKNAVPDIAKGINVKIS